VHTDILAQSAAIMSIEQQFPKLCHLAHFIFCCPAASSASERAFSNVGAVYYKRRWGTMASKTLEALCLLHS